MKLHKALVGFVEKHASDGAIVYPDDAPTYSDPPDTPSKFNHDWMMHSLDEYIHDSVYTSGTGLFRSTLQRNLTGTFHKLSPKQLNALFGSFLASTTY